MALAHVPKGVGDLAERVLPVDDGSELPVLEQPAQDSQIRLVELRDEEGGLPAPTQRRQAHPNDVAERPEPAIGHRAADEDDGRLRLEHALELRPRAAAGDVEDEVVAPIAPGEVLGGVVDDVVGSESASLLDVGGAAHGRHLGSERLRDLDRERADCARGAVDQHLLTGLDPALVTKPLQRGQPGDADSSRLLEGDVRGLAHDPALLTHAHVLGEGAVLATEDLVAGPEGRHVLADGLDDPGEVHTEPRLLRAA